MILSSQEHGELSNATPSTGTEQKREIYEIPKQMTTTIYGRQQNSDIYLNPAAQLY
jgi:hypothetical protein